MNRVRLFMIFQAATFIIASLIHNGILISGYEHHEAHIAEAVIALVLLVGLATTWLRPSRTRMAALVAQGFALAGTMVGLFTIAIGIGPRTLPDIVYHVAIMVVLVWGLVLARSLPESRFR